MTSGLLVVIQIFARNFAIGSPVALHWIEHPQEEVSRFANLRLKHTSHRTSLGGRGSCMGTRVDANAEQSWVRIRCEQFSVGDDDAFGEVEHVTSSHYTIQVRAILGANRDDANGSGIGMCTGTPMVKGVGLNKSQIFDTPSLSSNR